MCIIREVGKFFKRGSVVFREASKGEFERESDEVRMIRDEVFSEKLGTFNEDREKLTKDREKIACDIRQALNKMELNNG